MKSCLENKMLRVLLPGAKSLCAATATNENTALPPTSAPHRAEGTEGTQRCGCLKWMQEMLPGRAAGFLSSALCSHSSSALR